MKKDTQMFHWIRAYSASVKYVINQIYRHTSKWGSGFRNTEIIAVKINLKYNGLLRSFAGGLYHWKSIKIYLQLQ